MFMLIDNRGQHLWGKKNQRTRIRRYVLCWTSLAVQCLRLCTSRAGGAGSIPGRGTKLPHAVGHSQKEKEDMSYAMHSVLHSGDVSGVRVRRSLLECVRGGRVLSWAGYHEHLFMRLSFLDPGRVTMETTASGVNTVTMRKIYLRRPGSKRHVNKSSNLSILFPCRSTPK